MRLENKVAVIYGAGGSVGGAVARAFAREGATLFLTGRNRSSVEAVADEIVSEGGPPRRQRSMLLANKPWTDISSQPSKKRAA